MILLVSGATTEVKKAPREDVGVLVVPGARNDPSQLPLTRKWAMDNGAFSGLDVAAFERMLDRYQAYQAYQAAHGQVSQCLFVTAPDKVADADRTMCLFRQWEGRLHAWGWRVAFVGQDGLKLRDVPWVSLEAVFLGGSTEWKLGPVARDLAGYARARGKWVHMGRVNSARRLKHAMRIGCQSADGTGWSRWSKVYLPKIAGIKQSAYDAPWLVY